LHLEPGTPRRSGTPLVESTLPSPRVVFGQTRLKSGEDKSIIDDILTIGQYAGGVAKARPIRSPGVNVLDYMPPFPNFNAANKEGSDWLPPPFRETATTSSAHTPTPSETIHAYPVAGPEGPQMVPTGAWYIGLTVTTTPPHAVREVLLKADCCGGLRGGRAKACEIIGVLAGYAAPFVSIFWIQHANRFPRQATNVTPNQHPHCSL